MTKQELYADPTFLRLPENQQKFVRELVEGGNDKLAAAHLTWNCKNDASAIAMANRALKKAGVKKLTDAYFGIDTRDLLPSREEFLALCWEKCTKATDGAEAHKWAMLFASISNYKNAPPVTPPPADDGAEDELMAELEQRIDSRGSKTAV